MICIYNILIILFFNLSLSQESWSMTIVADDVDDQGALDYIVLGMCPSCNDDFNYGED